MVTTDSDIAWWRRPEVLTAGLVVFIALIGAVLRGVTDANATDRDYFTSVGFQIWLGTATLSTGLWLVLLINGVAELRRLTSGGATLRSGLACYLILAAITVVGLGAGQAPGEQDGPIRHFGAVSATLLVAGAVTAAPWVLAVWLAHHRVRAAGADIQALAATTATQAGGVPQPAASTPEPAAPAAASTPEPAAEAVAPPVRASIHTLQDVWHTIERCTIALVLLIATAVLMSGALRNALTAQVIAEEDFPPAAVLGYGALFAAILASAVLPLVTAWRAKAAALVDAALPLPHDRLPDEQWASDRDRLEKILHLDVSILRTPLVGLSILAPLVTAFIAAYVPGTPS